MGTVFTKAPKKKLNLLTN